MSDGDNIQIIRNHVSQILPLFTHWWISLQNISVQACGYGNLIMIYTLVGNLLFFPLSLYIISIEYFSKHRTTSMIFNGYMLFHFNNVLFIEGYIAVIIVIRNTKMNILLYILNCMSSDFLRIDTWF